MPCLSCDNPTKCLSSYRFANFVRREVRDFKPDLIHVSAPGVMVFAARLYAWLLKLPLVKSYHTHIPAYLGKYGIGENTMRAGVAPLTPCVSRTVPATICRAAAARHCNGLVTCYLSCLPPCCCLGIVVER